MTEKNLTGKTVLLVVPVTQFRDEEAFEPKRVLEAAGARVAIGASSARTCRGMQGNTLEAEVAVADANPDAYDALILAGGSSVPELFWKDKALVSLVSAMAAAGKIVAAISLATVVLAKAGLLEGKQATVYYLPEAIGELKSAGASYVKEKLVVDGNLIMAESPAAAGLFASAIATALAGVPVGTNP